MYKNLIFIVSLLSLWNCTSQFYKPVPKEFATKERINKAKGFAKAYFNKCNTKEYSEIQGYDIDASLKRRMFTAEKIEETCKQLTAKFGRISIGEFHSGITPTQPLNFSDLMVFNAKSEKNDSLKYITIGLYRDKDFISTIGLSNRSTPKINITIVK